MNCFPLSFLCHIRTWDASYVLRGDRMVHRMDRVRRMIVWSNLFFFQDLTVWSTVWTV